MRVNKLEPVVCADSLRRRFGQIARVLREHESLWRGAAFRELRLGWEEDYPQLARRLRGMDLATAAALDADPRRSAAYLARWLPTTQWRSLEGLERWQPCAAQRMPRGFDRDVPGRKWAQVTAFSACVQDRGLPFLEWCAGKGHLSRCLSQQRGGRSVLALERDPRLVADGNEFARRHGLPVRLQRSDVMQAQAERWLNATRHAVALHACGDLHTRLLQAGIRAALPAFSVAPCCYHLTQAQTILPLSEHARRDALVLRREDLRSAVQETVTAPGHARRQRSRLQSWQLGFDLLQRELRGVDEYLPAVPPAGSRASADFGEFCRQTAAARGIELPASPDFHRYERAGEERFRLVSALDLVRHQFRRLLELWRVFDLAMLLAEHGYRVRAGEFCDRACSPRNILLQAFFDADPERQATRPCAAHSG